MEQLEEEAKRAREEARKASACLKQDIGEATLKEHGPAHPYKETLSFQVRDAAFVDNLDSLPDSASRLDYLISNCDGKDIELLCHGWWGDITLIGWKSGG